MKNIETIRTIDDATVANMAAFRQANGGGVEHDARWLRVLSQGLGHEPRLLVDRRGGTWHGVLPLVLIRGRLFGRFVVSLPYVNRAGVLVEGDSSGTPSHALIRAACALTSGENARYLELRHEGAGTYHHALTESNRDKVRMKLSLPGDHDGLWQQIRSKVRSQIRKAERRDLAVTFGGVELVHDFHDVFSRHMRDLGTPVYPKRLFTAILEHIPGAELVVVRCDGQIAAASLLIHDEPTALTQVPSASCLRAFNSSNVNMWMYWQLLQRAISRGSGTFDFGRSSVDSGTYRFKKQWGAEPVETCWQYMPRVGSVQQLRPDTGRYDRLIRTWQHLPVWVTRLVGPAVVRGIP